MERPKTGWNFSVSIFKDYKGETDRLVNECFEFDWKCIKMPKITNSTEDEFRESCLMIYPFLRQIYRRLSASGVADIILAVGWNEFRNLIAIAKTANCVDGLAFRVCERRGHAQLHEFANINGIRENLEPRRYYGLSVG